MIFIKTLLVTLITTSCGFMDSIYFISVGFGFSVAGVGLFLIIRGNIALEEIIIGLLYMIHGSRLAIYVGMREKNANYQKKLSEETKNKKSIKLSIKIILWIYCSFLYACLTSPLTFRVLSDNKGDHLKYIGIIITLFGFILEAKADSEKSAAKKINPDKFVDSGLYNFVRCPNYLGELLFWTGNYIFGFKIYNGIFQWIIAFFGYILIIYILFGGARKIERRQNKSYGNNPDYQKYVKSTPILIPFIPLYSVQKYEWLRG